MYLARQYKSMLILISVISGAYVHALEDNFIANLPIDAATKYSKVYLTLSMPENFKQFQDDACPLAKFIPADEPEIDWSKMVIVETITEQEAVADDCMRQIKQRISQMDRRASILTDAFQYKWPYSVRKLIVKYYNPHRQREEVLLARYFSGRHECSGFQYIVAIKEDRSEEAALKELARFEKENACIKSY